MGLNWLLVEFVQGVNLDFPPFIEALLNCLQRQQGLGVEVTVKTYDLFFDGNASALMQLCRVEVNELSPDLDTVRPEVPEEVDWAGLRDSLAPGGHVIHRVLLVNKQDTENCPRDTLRALWESLVIINGKDVYFWKDQGEGGWQALEQFLDAPDDPDPDNE